MNFAYLHNKLDNLTQQISQLQQQIKSLPTGNLILSRNHTRYKWYRSDGKNHYYIPKKDRKLAEQLAQKKHLSLLLKEAEQDQKAIHYFLKYHSPSPPPSTQLLSESSEYSHLLSSYFQSLPCEFLHWMKTPYERNLQYPEKLIHKSCSGNVVRSKSEALIDMLLYTHKIPFRYECLLHLGTVSLYPDFTILHPQTKKIYYWEHFGMMDNPDYQIKTLSKLQHYISHGLIPTMQLITTFETKDQPLTYDAVDKIIHDYFLEY